MKRLAHGKTLTQILSILDGQVLDVLDDVLVAVDDGLVEQARAGPTVLGKDELFPRQVSL